MTNSEQRSFQDKFDCCGFSDGDVSTTIAPNATTTTPMHYAQWDK